jgi:Acetyltransferase (GNAT) domain
MPTISMARHCLTWTTQRVRLQRYQPSGNSVSNRQHCPQVPLDTGQPASIRMPTLQQVVAQAEEAGSAVSAWTSWLTGRGPHKVEVGWELHRAFWGRGWPPRRPGRGALWVRDGGLERIISITMATNAASRRVMEKCGLDSRGELAMAGTEVAWYAIDRADWEAAHRCPTRPARPGGSRCGSPSSSPHPAPAGPPDTSGNRST